MSSHKNGQPAFMFSIAVQAVRSRGEKTFDLQIRKNSPPGHSRRQISPDGNTRLERKKANFGLKPF